MAFGLFKKKLAADLILKNGRIITQNAEMPQAEAVACKDNKIIAVGSIDSMDSLINDHTQVVDMEGKMCIRDRCKPRAAAGRLLFKYKSSGNTYITLFCAVSYYKMAVFFGHRISFPAKVLKYFYCLLYTSRCV